MLCWQKVFNVVAKHSTNFALLTLPYTAGDLLRRFREPRATHAADNLSVGMWRFECADWSLIAGTYLETKLHKFWTGCENCKMANQVDCLAFFVNGKKVNNKTLRVSKNYLNSFVFVRPLRVINWIISVSHSTLTVSNLIKPQVIHTHRK